MSKYILWCHSNSNNNNSNSNSDDNSNSNNNNTDDYTPKTTKGIIIIIMIEMMTIVIVGKM